MSEQAVNKLMQRLVRVERANRWFKILGSAIVLAIGGIMLMGQAGSKRVPKTVEAQEFVLRDMTGEVRGALHITPEGEPGLFLLSKYGQAQVIVGRFGPILRLYDQNKAKRVAISILGTGENDLGPTLQLFNKNGELRASMSVTENVASLRLTDNDRRGQISLTSGGLGKSQSLAIWDKDGKIRTILNDSPSLTLHHKDEKLLALGTTDMGGLRRYESSLILFDKDRGIIWKAP